MLFAAGMLMTLPVRAQPCEPSTIGILDAFVGDLGIDVHDGLIYVTHDYHNRLEIVDASNPASLWVIGSAGVIDCREVVVNDGMAYVINTGELFVVDVADPASPTVLCRHDMDFTWYDDLAVRDHYVFIAAAHDGLLILDASDPYSPVLIATVPVSERAEAVAVNGPMVYVTDYTSGIIVIDAADPFAPVVRATIPTPNETNDIAVEGTMVYAVTNSQLLVIDASDPANPTLTGAASPPLSDNSMFRLAISDGLVAVTRNTGGARGMHLFDVQDPTAPAYAGVLDTWPEVRYWDVWMEGDLACVSMGPGAIRTIDVSGCRANTPCNAADFAPPFGVLDQADVAAFVAAFLSGDPAADLDANAIHELRDIIAFVDAFVSGCP
jgi:hypothetical protein